MTDNIVTDDEIRDKSITETIAKSLGLRISGVNAVIRLLDEGATVPFISRYRKEQTGSLDEVSVRNIETTLKNVRELFDRRDYIRKMITSAGALTDSITRKLDEAVTMTELEDIYAPYKPKKRTRATIAREKGLEPLAKIIMSGRTYDCAQAAERFAGKNDVKDADEALSGAADIIAEWASESTRLRNITRNAYHRNGCLKTSVVKGKDEDLALSPFAQYSDFSQSVKRMASHQYLAIRRAEKEGFVKAKYELNNLRENIEDTLADNFIPHNATEDCADLIYDAVCDAAKRLLRPSIETEISSELKAEADKTAIGIFASNLRQLLLGSPLRGRKVLAIDPGYRTGCKVAALDEQGNLLTHGVIYPTPPRNDTEGAAAYLKKLINRFGSNAISLGNGTASRETERFLKSNKIMPDNAIFIVSEDGASIYSASEIARKEFPDEDVTVRGAVSIGRRLIDPLAELVKIDPKSIGVGQYQHDVDQSQLKNALDYTVMSCVNSVGVNVNTASPSLLQYVSGIGTSLAENIVKYRSANGPFSSRKELKKVPRLGDKAFEQAAGFLRIPEGKEPLDNTGIHPESYELVKKMAATVGATVNELPGNAELLDKINVKELAAAKIGGEETMTDIINELRKPGRDPRDEDAEAFIPGVEDFAGLRTGMHLQGKVANITAFGAFVDLGIKENGLIHISKLGRRVSAVSDVLNLGQLIEVEVIDLDMARKRISLSLISNPAASKI